MDRGLTAPLTGEEALAYQTRLWQLLSRQAEKYTMGESTSLRRETAQALLESIVLSLEAHFREQGLSPHALLAGDPEALLRAAEETVRRQVRRTQLLYHRACRCVLQEESISLRETLESIGGFFRAYDPRFFAGDVPCDIDYQLSRPVDESLRGVWYLRAWLEQLVTEDAFLRRFDPAAVRRLLAAVCPEGHRELLVNLYEPTATAALGLTMTEGPLNGLSQTPVGWIHLTDLLGTTDPEKRRRTMEQAGERLARRLELGPQGTACLLACAGGLLPRIGAVLESGSGWQGLFPILD